MTEPLSLQPRHQVIIDFLTKNAPKRYSAKDIASNCKLTATTTGNEMLTVMRLHPKIQRSVRGRVYKYYIGEPDAVSLDMVDKRLSDWGKPIPSRADIGGIYDASTSEDYKPAVAKLAWKLGLVMAMVGKAATTGDLSSLSEARRALEEISDSATAYAVTLSRILSTEELWADPAWLVQGMPEENLEKLRERSRQAIERLAKLHSEHGEPTKETP